MNVFWALYLRIGSQEKENELLHFFFIYTFLIMIYHNHHKWYCCCYLNIELICQNFSFFKTNPFFHWSIVFFFLQQEGYKEEEERIKPKTNKTTLTLLTYRDTNFLLTHVVTHKFNNWCDRKLSIEHWSFFCSLHFFIFLNRRSIHTRTICTIILLFCFFYLTMLQINLDVHEENLFF